MVAIRAWRTDPRGTVKAALDNRNPLIDHKALPGVDIYLYRLD
jgi:hypothetical protein